MNIETTYDPQPGASRWHHWTAIDADTHKGDNDPIGYGETKEDAVADLLEAIDAAKIAKLDDLLPVRISRDIFGVVHTVDTNGRGFVQPAHDFAGCSYSDKAKFGEDWQSVAVEICEAVNGYAPMRAAAQEAFDALQLVRLEGFGPSERAAIVKARINLRRTLDGRS